LNKRNILQHLDLKRLYPEKGSTVFLHCPFHKDGDKPNLLVNRNYTYCFVCNRTEGAIEFLQRVQADKASLLVQERGITPLQAAWLIAETLTVATPINRALPDTTVTMDKRDLLVYRSKLADSPDKQQQLLKKYGIGVQTQLDNGLGYTGRAFTIPVFTPQKKLVTFRFRNDDSKFPNPPYRYWGVPGNNKPALYIPPALLKGNKGFNP
jgi:DNA primase